jgi:hypothetical protein
MHRQPPALREKEKESEHTSGIRIDVKIRSFNEKSLPSSSIDEGEKYWLVSSATK